MKRGTKNKTEPSQDSESSSLEEEQLNDIGFDYTEGYDYNPWHSSQISRKASTSSEEKDSREEDSEQDNENEENSEQDSENEENSDEESSDEESSDEESSGDEDSVEEKPTKKHRKDTKKKGDFFAERTDGKGITIQRFEDLKISPSILRGVKSMNYSVPTAVQSAVIPLALKGKDICASAQTGSGKTAAFTIPFLERLLHRDKRFKATRVLLLAPTRELASQCKDAIDELCAFTDIETCLVVGGLSLKMQEAALRSLPDVLVATPGRLIDHLRNAPSFALDSIDVLVLDEADRLLDLGFKDELEEILKYTPVRRQTMLFSATMTEKVSALARMSLRNPVRVNVHHTHHIATGISQEFIRISGDSEYNPHKKEAMLLALCSHTFTDRVLVFFSTKKQTHKMYTLLKVAGLRVGELHSGLSQTQRMDALYGFRKGEVGVLMCTGLAARGLDIRGIRVVINYSLPRNLEEYIHRVGRTARAHETGKAISFVHDSTDHNLLQAIIKASNKTPKKRTVASNAVTEWQERIDTELESRVFDILQEENADNELRELERQINTAKNKLDNADEIFSRPKRTWFQSEKEKAEVKELTKLKEEKRYEETKKKRKKESVPKRKLEKYAGMSRKKRRRAKAREEIMRMKKRGKIQGVDARGANFKKKSTSKRGRSSAPAHSASSKHSSSSSSSSNFAREVTSVSKKKMKGTKVFTRGQGKPRKKR